MNDTLNQVYTYIKYQLITKGMLAALYPILNSAISFLVKSKGLDHLSNSNLLGFLLSVQGIGFLFLLFTFLSFLVATDIHAFVILSWAYHEQHNIGIKELFKQSFQSLKVYFNPLGILILIYIAVILPLLGIGLTIGPMQHFQLPNFILEPIFQNKLYSGLYLFIMVALLVLAVLHIFFFHYIIIGRRDLQTALKDSRTLIKLNVKQFVVDFYLWLVALGSFLLIIIVSAMTLLDDLPYHHHLSPMEGRTLALLGLLFLVELVAVLTLMTVPLLTTRLTTLFYKYNQVQLPPKQSKKKSAQALYGLTMGVLGISLFNLAIAYHFSQHFDSIFDPAIAIDIVAHRGGGNLAAENSVKGMLEAYKKGAQYSEIDVQRTADGHYIINHDPTFKRLSCLSKASYQLNLADIQQLNIKDSFQPTRNSQPIATLDEFLTQAKGRMGLFIELKGKTADTKMVDDIVQKIESHGMADQAVLVSLDYDLIHYAEDQYPAITTGFIYFFAHGPLADIKTDILIMEEKMATPAKIEDAHASGKKVVVWTVNTDDNIHSFVQTEVDGIITDQVQKVQAAIRNRQSRNDFEKMLDYFFT